VIGVDDTLDDATDQTAPVWAVFGDLMAGLLGAFVLILVGVLVVQIDLVASLQQEVQKRQMEEQRRMALEKALAVPLAAGRVTVNNGRIGISGSVLFATARTNCGPRDDSYSKAWSSHWGCTCASAMKCSWSAASPTTPRYCAAARNVLRTTWSCRPSAHSP